MINLDRKCKTLTVKSKSHKKAKFMNSERQTDRETDRQTDRRRDRYIEGQADRKSCRQMER